MLLSKSIGESDGTGLVHVLDSFSTGCGDICFAALNNLDMQIFGQPI